MSQNDGDPDNDPLTFSVVSGPGSGSLQFNPDGTFTYTPAQHWVGQTSFTYAASDGTDSTPATAYIDVYNYGVSAGNDSFTLTLTHTPAPIALYVLSNDYDVDNDDINIVAVSSLQGGGQITIDSSGDFLWYTPPSLGSSDAWSQLDTSGEPVDVGSTTGGPGGVESAFGISFQYTISDPIGETGTGSVTAEATVAEPTWTWTLTEDYEAEDIGIGDGAAGYDLHITQYLGLNAVGSKLRPDEQLWQVNTLYNKVYYVNNGNLAKYDQTDYVLDVMNKGGAAFGIELTDQNAAIPLGANLPLFINELVVKKAGRNGYQDPFGTLMLLDLDDGMHEITSDDAHMYLDIMRGATLEITGVYTYVNKTAIELFKNTDPAKYDEIVGVIDGMGLDYDGLGGTWERLQIGDIVFGP